ncbi:hypothetical protein WG922_12120 [Ramlibacter sp. AN1015]|uniref:hypothetical protein n=1 Tax=Ramlibacter sp. AN1015 TaxID=3133428 RepID=UPI0030BC16DB
MNPALQAIRQPNGDLLIPAETAHLLELVLERLQEEVDNMHGKTFAEPGAMETDRETANRQDSVDKLSAAMGIDGHSVSPRRRPDTHQLVDSTETRELLKAVSSLLFDRA